MGRRALTSLAAAGVALALAAGCARGRTRRADEQDAGVLVKAIVGQPIDKAPATAAQTPGEPVPCPVADRHDVDRALDEAARRFEQHDFVVALACAEQAGRVAPRSVEAHHDRADALAALERWDEARQAFTLALALDPDDPQTLASAADFYVNRLPPSHDSTLIGLEYARRGSSRVGRRRDDRELQARLALLEAEALDDLGRTDEALPRIETAVALDPRNAEARYERALILFHLCRLDKALQGFEDVLSKSPDDAYAHHHLGLILERKGREVEAETHLARARALAPKQFAPPVLVPPAEFRGIVDAAVGELDPATRGLLAGVKVEIADLPALADLTAVDPPFPPTILGLFRGAPLGDPTAPAGEARAIVLYRKNHARAVTTRDELVKQVKITLLHEIGHLTGADEHDLRARGLE